MLENLTVDQLSKSSNLKDIKGLSKETMQELKRKVPALMAWWTEESAKQNR